MWSFGYTDPFGQNGTEDVFMGECSTFTGAVSELYDNVEKMASDGETYSMLYYEQILDSIRTIRDDCAYWEDPDQWEDMEFFGQLGDSDQIVFYVIED